MSSLQRMAGRRDFFSFPDSIKKCQEEDMERCHTSKYFDRLKELCGCVPWGLYTVMPLALEVSLVYSNSGFLDI